MLFPPSKEVVRWNSHEHDELGITTEEPTAVTLMHNKRIKKIQTIKNILRNRKTINVYGDKGLTIFTYGSSTMSVLEAINYGQIEAVVIQPIYLNPLPVWELEKYKNKKAIVVEQSSIGQFSNLLKEQAGLSFENVIKQYNGRPFDPIELSNKIREVL
jgi:2-oxoglutarate ferredoxin oxidoreductase subunit alpha